MANFINKYLNQSAYDADDTKQYPNTSLVGTSIVFEMEAPAPAFGGLTVKYNIVDTSDEVPLFSGVGGSSSSGSSESSSESGGGGALPTTMIVDGVSETPINTWRFETAGEHIVQYEFTDNIVPAGFLNGSVATATEAIIGDDITEISYDSVTNIGAFTNSTLTTATIGNGVTTIGQDAFAGCKSLTSITVEATTPPTLGAHALRDTSITAIYVPASAVEEYQTSTSTGWSDWANRIQAIS